jgi:hypothetical protein
MLSVTKVISGGQVGADVAGLRAARALGLETGGWIPKGFRTIRGNRPELGRDFSLVETPTREYPPRTHANVRYSDATARFAVGRAGFCGRGELCALKAVKACVRPYFDVDLSMLPLDPSELRAWLESLPGSGVTVRTLNVAGSADERIEADVEAYLTEALRP